MRHERDFTPAPGTGAFFGNHHLYRQKVDFLDNLPDRLFIQKAWSQYVVVTHGWLRRVMLGGSLKIIERRGCKFALLTNEYDHTKIFHAARRQLNFPHEFSRIVMSLYDETTISPAKMARQMIREIKPGTNLSLVARLYNSSDDADRNWTGLKMLLQAHAPPPLIPAYLREQVA